MEIADISQGWQVGVAATEELLVNSRNLIGVIQLCKYYLFILGIRYAGREKINYNLYIIIAYARKH